jgi:L-2-hydroxyglutarate oxidase LhgO
VGIRAQLLDKDRNELVMDFLVEKMDNTTHVLNAVSPAFTSAFSFAKYILNK